MKYALRQTNKGYQLTEVSEKICYHGKTRKFASGTSLIYKKLNYAEAQAHDFYKRVYPKSERQYIGIIKENEYQGETM